MLIGIPTTALAPGSVGWLSTISASQIAAIVGVSPWETPYSLWHTKRGTYTRPANQAMATGTHWEPHIRDWYRDTNPDSAVTGEQSFRHPELPWATATPDGIIDDQRGLEIKTARYPDGWGEPGTDQVPEYYRTQVQWQMLVTGAPAVHVLLCTPYEIFDRTFREYVVPRDEAYINVLVDAAEAFRLWLDLGMEPDPDWRVPADRDVLRATALPRTDDSVELDDDTARTWLMARDARIGAETDEEAAKAALLAYAGTARRLIWQGREIASLRNSKHGPALYPAKNIDLNTLLSGKDAA